MLFESERLVLRALEPEDFEWLAKSVPLSVLRKHSDSLLQLEALLFGQAGI